MAMNSLEALTWDKVPGGCCRSECMVANHDQIIGCIRHSERLDYLPVVKRMQTEGAPPGREGEWPWAIGAAEPFDLWNPPLTEPRGIELANQSAQNLLEAFRQTARKIRGRDLDLSRVVVITSPLVRCVQTAVEVCRVFETDLLVDNELVEINDEKAMHTKVSVKLPTYQDVQKAFPDAPFVQDAGLGESPEFPETWEQYRGRYVKMLQRYLDRGAQTQMDFILVCHGDFLPVALNLCKPETWFNCEYDIDFCAYMIISRTAELRLTPEELEELKGKENPTAVPIIKGNTWKSKNLEVDVPANSPMKYTLNAKKKGIDMNCEAEWVLMSQDAANPDIAKSASKPKDSVAEIATIRRSMSQISVRRSMSTMSTGLAGGSNSATLSTGLGGSSNSAVFTSAVPSASPSMVSNGGPPCTSLSGQYDMGGVGHDFSVTASSPNAATLPGTLEVEDF